jgi:hypothetical protein
MELKDIKENSKIYVDVTDGSKYIIFKHLDGMYSLCETEKENLLHLKFNTPLEEYKDGYKIIK